MSIRIFLSANGEVGNTPCVVEKKSKVIHTSYGSSFIRDIIEDDESSDTDSDIVFDSALVSKDALQVFSTFMNNYPDDPFESVVKPMTTFDFHKLVPNWAVQLLELSAAKLVEINDGANYLRCTKLSELCLMKLACIIKKAEVDEIETLFEIGEDRRVSEEQAKVFVQKFPIFKSLSTN